MNEEEIFDFQDQHGLITLGWIHVCLNLSYGMKRNIKDIHFF